ncbi:16S rRNA (cytosine(1402)-N(4))-methyltransferase RsmH [Blochmannia endosymbiont of Camponotus sp. C-046]|uniref:16S rRNA (cytosine(1402)-N(4))-methyltransferase RsmH n=1 Tax=Blochmannia endosymbiont of Camponotus sp. C-046 TaxID=2945589 RepID=UPI0020254331|nr:16S rRNA (cytosine(1402)-N(4))-methyltransferase RsmH [Blochmannia endosymbiont of Camponotus sp. C-046]URJ28576.1 16S rRNA (cytosine(1402)-N(4))-methyltransferase RsmH [Blochmannia endosymbiont of Camponotus sp. C-046]
MFHINYTHKSVLLHEAIQLLNINSTGIYIDGTFGSGGHAKLILSQLNKQGRLLAIDKDLLAIKIGKCIAEQDDRFTIIHSSFSKTIEYVKNVGLIGLVDGILLDLGISTYQINDCSRGFSFMQDGLLDMRMDISNGISAAEWLSKASQENIAWVLKTFGEERFSKNIAKVIVSKRQHTPIIRSIVLSKLICDAVPLRNMRKHPATKSFLAIRMYINNELEEIKQILKDALVILAPRGRLVVISFNSLEDRLVKYFVREHSCVWSLPPKIPLTNNQIFNQYKSKCQLKNIGKLTPSKQEIKRNIRARSAILRCAEKLVM